MDFCNWTFKNQQYSLRPQKELRMSSHGYEQDHRVSVISATLHLRFHRNQSFNQLSCSIRRSDTGTNLYQKINIEKARSRSCGLLFEKVSLTEVRNYSSISMTTPEPTVRPPSRIAKRRPFSIAMGAISSTFMSTLSPGMHISVPSGRVMMPVTSVVRK